MAKRQRTMTDEEIALAKAMLKRGLKNDTIHFYFNRSDRLISSGRIAQIKGGKYGAAIEEATPAALDAFLLEWEARQRTAPTASPSSPVDRVTLLPMFGEVAGSWTMIVGETDRVECKRSFRLTPEHRFADIIKSIAGLANNRGGYIFVGVADRVFTVDGVPDETFANTDPADINRSLAGALDPVPHITKAVVEIGGRAIGVLYVEKHDYAPVVALKNIASDVREGTIYYRYVGETRAIKPGELRQIIAMREQRAVAEFSQRMMRVASGSEATLNLDTGEVKGKSGGFVIDRDLLPSIQFLREGDFSEVKGAPALRLIGDVEPVDAAERERARIIRDNVTPDAVIRNFLRGEGVNDPMQYIHAQAHCQRRWLPVWYYVEQAGTPIDDIVEDLRAQVASHPSSRDAVVQRLRRTETAHKVHVGKPARLCEGFARGEINEPAGGADDLAFANAVMGLPSTAVEVERFKPILLACLDRAETAGNGTHRSAIYRAACRLDELLHGSATTAS
jgi:hypothetical protein